jgi:hypothetical protein
MHLHQKLVSFPFSNCENREKKPVDLQKCHLKELRNYRGQGGGANSGGPAEQQHMTGVSKLKPPWQPSVWHPTVTA